MIITAYYTSLTSCIRSIFGQKYTEYMAKNIQNIWPKDIKIINKIVKINKNQTIKTTIETKFQDIFQQNVLLYI